MTNLCELFSYPYFTPGHGSHGCVGTFRRSRTDAGYATELIMEGYMTLSLVYCGVMNTQGKTKMSYGDAHFLVFGSKTDTRCLRTDGFMGQRNIPSKTCKLSRPDIAKVTRL